MTVFRNIPQKSKMAASRGIKACTDIQKEISRSASFLNFRDTVRTRLSRKASQHSMDIFLDIAVVLVGLKPGFLFDYTFVDNPTTLVELCERVITTLRDVFSPYHNQLPGPTALYHTWTDMKANYRICKVAGDVFVLDIERTVDYLRQISSDNLKHGGGSIVIDVSHSLPKPEFATEETLLKLQGMLNAVVRRINDGKVHDSQVIELHLKKDWNVTSLFGFLLGYPVVYWYESPEGKNGLSMVPLTVYKLYSVPDQELTSEHIKHCAKSGDRNKHTIFSFSMPTELKQKCQQLIEDWFTGLTENWKKCRFHNLFGDVVLNETESVLPCVAL